MVSALRATDSPTRADEQRQPLWPVSIIFYRREGCVMCGTWFERGTVHNDERRQCYLSLVVSLAGNDREIAADDILPKEGLFHGNKPYAAIAAP